MKYSSPTALLNALGGKTATRKTFFQIKGGRLTTRFGGTVIYAGPRLWTRTRGLVWDNTTGGEEGEVTGALDKLHVAVPVSGVSVSGRGTRRVDLARGGRPR